MKILEFMGQRLARYLSSPRKNSTQVATTPPGYLSNTLQPGDVLLVDGNSTISTAIKYLTQSSWSHAALFVGSSLLSSPQGEDEHVLVEADINDGVRSIPLSTYTSYHTRICRPVGLTKNELTKVVEYTTARLGHQYDLQNVIDLARYLFPTPPVPLRFRRRLLSLGSGNPTQAICSSLIAQAFQAVHYPILPEVVVNTSHDPACINCYREMLHIRHHSLFTPRDFDVSPYFQIIKPTLEHDFDPHNLPWADADLRLHSSSSAGKN